MKKIIFLSFVVFLSGCVSMVETAINSTVKLAKVLNEAVGDNDSAFKLSAGKRIKEINVYPAKYSEKAGRYIIVDLGLSPKLVGVTRKIFRMPTKKVSFYYNEKGFLELQKLESPNVSTYSFKGVDQDKGVYLKLDELSKYEYDESTARINETVNNGSVAKEYSYLFESGYPVKYFSHSYGEDKLLKEFKYEHGTLKMIKEGSRYTKYNDGSWDAVTVEQGDSLDSSLPVTIHELGKLNFKFSLAGVAVAAHQIYTHKVDGVVVDTMQIDSSVVDDKYKSPKTTPMTTPLGKYEKLVYDEDGYILSFLNKDVNSTLYEAEIVEYIYEDGRSNTKYLNPPKDLDEQLGLIKYY